MMRILLAIAWLLAVAPGMAHAADIELIAAGSSFAAPLLDAWGERFFRETGITLRYRSVGSAEGIRRVTARAADFAMTDVPLTEAELVQDDLMQFPVIVGAIVPVVNLPGIRDGDLRLTGAVLAEIYLGKIASWDAPELRALNPDMMLPTLPIRVVHRADGSGTSFIFTYYLSQASPEWSARLGVGSRLIWPAGSGAKGNEGVSETVADTVGAIGYVEYTYALQQHLAATQLRNRAGRFVRAGDAATRAALAAARWTRPGYYEVLTDRDGEDSWPIVGASFALVHKRQESHADAAAVLSFLDWAYGHGADAARALHYVSLDDAGLIRRIESSWSDVYDEDGEPVWHDGASR